MTTFQAIVFAIIRGFTQFLPLSWDGHQILVPWLLHWPDPSGHFAGVLALGSFFAAFLFFWNDWASLISSVLQVILLRRKPMILDERMPFFILIAILPYLLLESRLAEHTHLLTESPWVVAAILGAFGLPLWVTDSRNRQNKNLFDWNWIDAVIVGVSLILVAALPGIGVLSATLVVGFFRNYAKEAAAKFAIYAMTPLLLVQAIQDLQGIDFHSAIPAPDMTWLSLAVAFIVSVLTGILTIGAFFKHLQRKGVGQYVVYRIAFAVGSLAILWYRNRVG